MKLFSIFFCSHYYQRTVLHEAVEENLANTFNFLLGCPLIDVNVLDEFDNTSLTLASEYGFIDFVKALLERPETDVNLGKTLYKACKYGRLEVVKLLVATPNIDVNKEVGNSCCAVPID